VVAKRRRAVLFVPRAALGSSSSSSQSSPYDALIEALVPLVAATTTTTSSLPPSAAAVPPPLRAAFALADDQQQQQQAGGWVLANSSSSGSNDDNAPCSSSLAPLLAPLSLNPTLVLARVAQLERAARDRPRRAQLASIGAALSALIAEREARLAERLLSENAAAADSRRRYKEWKDEEVEEDDDGIGQRRFSVAVGGGGGVGADGRATTALDDLYTFGERLERDERLERERAARDRQREERRREEFLMDPTVGDRLRAEVEEKEQEARPTPQQPPQQPRPPPAPPKIAPELGSASFFMTGKAAVGGATDNSALAMATARLRARLAQVDEEKARRGLGPDSETATTQTTTFEARSILAHLLREYEYPEERAAMLPEACTLPGMATRVEGGTEEVTLRTTPADLRAALEEEKRRRSKSEEESEVLDELLVDLEGYERVWKVVNGVD
jgi:hypothetical protein